MSRTYEIVVARYKENVDWIELINPTCKVTVYNKFEGENLIENVGRESHTYLYHIIKNYDNLSDYTFFVQGNPIEHCDRFISLVDQISSKDGGQDFQMLLDSENNTIQCDPNGQPFGIIGEKYIPAGLLYESLTLRTSPDFFLASPGCQFVVSKKAIRSWKKEFYEKAIRYVSYDVNPIEGHCFERIFPMILEPRFQYLGVQISYPNDNFHNEYLKNNNVGGKISLLGEIAKI